MSIIKVILRFGILTFLFDYTMGAATEEQMMAAGKLMRDACLPRFSKVSKEVADNIAKGIIPEDKDVKCYINCVLEMMQSIKKGKFLYESSIKQVDLLMPDSYKEDYYSGLGKCKDATTGIKNNCDAAYALLKCFSAEIPSFLFP